MMWPILTAVPLILIIVGYYVGLVIGQKQAQMLLVLRNQTASGPGTSAFKDAEALFLEAKEAPGSASSMEPLLRDPNEATPPDICPTCKRPIADRTDSKSNGIPRHVHFNEGTGPEYNAGFVDFSHRWFHYIPRDKIKEWESLGWKVKELGPYHEQFSVLGEWGGDGEPVKP